MAQKKGSPVKRKPPQKAVPAYKKGDTFIAGSVIQKIISRKKEYIIAITQDNNLAYEITELDEIKKKAIAEMNRLHRIAERKFLGAHKTQVNILLARALSKAFESDTAEEIKDHFMSVNDFIKNNAAIDQLYLQTRESVIYRTKKNTVSFQHSNLKHFLQPAVTEFNRVQNQVKVCLGKNHPKIANLLGTALAVSFSSDPKDNVLKYFKNSHPYIEQIIDSTLRFHQLAYSFLFGIVLTCIFLLLHIPTGFDIIDQHIMIGAAGGIIGGLISLVQRNRTLRIDPFIPWTHIIFHALIRMILACLFGILVILISQSNLVLGILKNNSHVQFLLSIIGGICERIVPDTLKQLKDNASYIA
jgi:hypothetical protein